MARRYRAMNPPTPWSVLPQYLGISAYIIRSALEPEYRERRLIAKKQARVECKKQKNERKMRILEVAHEKAVEARIARGLSSALTIPRQVLIERDQRRQLSPRDLT